MNEDLQVFTNPDFGDVRTLNVNDQPWFVGKDVAAALGYVEPTKTVREKVDAEDKGVSKIDTPSGTQEMLIINESGLYSLILSSKLPAAKKFKRWVTAEVLPALRKNGCYNIVTAPAATEQRALTTDDYLKAAQIVASCRNERLPYVMHYLTQGGFETPRFADMESGVGDSARAVQLIMDAKSGYGMNNAQIGRIVGLDRVQISRYANGQCEMSAHRAARVIQQLTDALSQMEESEQET